MKIRLVTENASERLLWQHRIMNCQPPEPIEWVTEAAKNKDKLVWLISSEQSLSAYYQARANGDCNKISTLVIVTDAYKVVADDANYKAAIGNLKQAAEVLLCEADFEPGLLRQGLFKPCNPLNWPTVNWKRSWIKSNAFPKGQSAWGCKPQHVKLCVSGPAALAYELGAVYAMRPDCHVLVIDLDRFTPTADLYTGVKSILESPYAFFNKASATGLNVILDCAKKGNLQKDIFSKCAQRVKGFERLHVLTGVYQLADYEYYRAEDIKAIIERAAGYYDVILMRTNSFIYDGFTLMAQKLADLVLTGLEPDIGAFRAYRQSTHLLKEKQGIPLTAQRWVLAETHKISSSEVAFYEQLAGSDCMGRIPYLVERQHCAATGSGYLKRVERQLVNAYKPVLQAIEKVGVNA